jgi:hypothetical protein
VSETLASLTLVGRDELAGPPALLVEHRAALVAQRPARVVTTFAFVILKQRKLEYFIFANFGIFALAFAVIEINSQKKILRF